jgi:transcriptional regulator with XRE-family HTH domain
VDIDDQHIGRRVREIRSWRGMDQQALAGLAGISQSYLSMIERGERAVTKRATLETLASALQVSPTELTGQPYQPSDPLSNDVHSGISAIEVALDRYELGNDPGVAGRPWPEVSDAVKELNGVLRAEANYVAQSMVVPGLLADLHATYARDPEHRRDALVGLMYAYRSAASICKTWASEDFHYSPPGWRKHARKNSTAPNGSGTLRIFGGLCPAHTDGPTSTPCPCGPSTSSAAIRKVRTLSR